MYTKQRHGASAIDTRISDEYSTRPLAKKKISQYFSSTDTYIRDVAKISNRQNFDDQSRKTWLTLKRKSYQDMVFQPEK